MVVVVLPALSEAEGKDLHLLSSSGLLEAAMSGYCTLG